MFLWKEKHSCKIAKYDVNESRRISDKYPYEIYVFLCLNDLSHSKQKLSKTYVF
jgi:hypothetical protein